MPNPTETLPDESFFRHLVEASLEGVVVSSDGRIVFVNAQIEKLFGYAREELVGQPVEI